MTNRFCESHSARRLDPSLRPTQNLPHLRMPPLATVSRSDFPRVQLPGDGIEACVASRLDVPNDRQHVRSELRRLRLAGHAHALDGAGGVGRA
jgi:hypothetical protein